MILANYTKFLDKIFRHLERLGINVSRFEIDHIAYATSSGSEYDKLKPEFVKHGKLIRENIIGKRRVGVCKLFKKLRYKNYSISALEFMEPKKGEIKKSGLEHAEFIIDSGLEDFMKKYSTLPWDSSHIRRDRFPRLKLILEKGLEVKFHLASILEE